MSETREVSFFESDHLGPVILEQQMDPELAKELCRYIRSVEKERDGLRKAASDRLLADLHSLRR